MKRIELLNKHLTGQNTLWVLKNVEAFEFEKAAGNGLKGKTIFISGASRGIGLAMGVRAAQDGANVVIAAKTVKPDPRLEGTIYTAAAEIDKAGGKGLAIQVDIRDEESVRKAVEKTVETFGGIDILINNASAIYNTPVEATNMKKYDLSMDINVRGTFLCSKYCIPHLKKAKNPHILTISPPLDMVSDKEVNWFGKAGTGYTLAKYGMTLVSHGMAAELKEDGIACNTLWPRTAVATAAVKNLLGGDATINISRTPQIMGDSAYIILTSLSTKTTDNFFIDDEVLASDGITDLSKYKCNPKGKEIDLAADFFC